MLAPESSQIRKGLLTGHDVSWVHRHGRDGNFISVKLALQLVRPEHVREFCVRCRDPELAMSESLAKRRDLTINVRLWLPCASKVVVKRFQAVVPRIRYPSVRDRRYLL